MTDLFELQLQDAVVVRETKVRERVKRAGIAAPEFWKFTDHCCATCFGRIMQSKNEDGRVYRCADCGASHTDRESICSCGMRWPGRRGSKKPGKLIGVHCVVNDNRTPQSPSEIVATEA